LALTTILQMMNVSMISTLCVTTMAICRVDTTLVSCAVILVFHHRHRIDKYLDIRRPVVTAADLVSTDHSQTHKMGGLPELLLT